MNKKRQTIIVLSILLSILVKNILGQQVKVVRFYPEKRLAIINQGLQHGLKQGADLKIFRMINGEFETIAKVKVVKLVKGHSIVKIISLTSGKDVAIGDIVSSSADFLKFSGATKRRGDNKIIDSQNEQFKSKGNNLAWSLIGVGITSAGIAGYTHFEGSNNYKKYKSYYLLQHYFFLLLNFLKPFLW